MIFIYYYALVPAHLCVPAGFPQRTTKKRQEARNSCAGGLKENDGRGKSKAGAFGEATGERTGRAVDP